VTRFWGLWGPRISSVSTQVKRLPCEAQESHPYLRKSSGYPVKPKNLIRIYASQAATLWGAKIPSVSGGQPSTLCVIGSRLLARWKCVMRDGASAAGPDSSD
jgi:hypothetical protein